MSLATPKLVDLVKKAVADAPEPRALFEHFSFTIGLRTQDREGISRLQQLKVLQPYFQFLSDFDLVSLWENCIERSWLDYAREHLEPIMRSCNSDLVKRVLGHAMIDLSDLDSDFDKRQPWRAYHWLEEEIRRGARREELIVALFDWFKQKKSLLALKIVGEVLSKDGTRFEFVQLMETVSDMQDADEIINEVQFNIFRHSLI